jgi:LDH2 family malate/lactate/ureidoglycolate dehydrogenase
MFRIFSQLWWEVEEIAAQGLVALCFVNTAAFVAHAPGGARPVYGTNPLAFGCPRGGGRAPLVFDQASAAMARGEIQLCLRDGKALPAGVAIDLSGAPTTDPQRALDGAQLPMGGHKGSNLALMVELLAGVLTASPSAAVGAAALASAALAAAAPSAAPAGSGAAAPLWAASTSPGSLGQRPSSARPEPLPLGGMPTEQGELIIALDPACLGVAGGGLAGFEERVEGLLASVASSMGDNARLPGERRQAQRAKTAARGGLVDVKAELLATVERAASS